MSDAPCPVDICIATYRRTERLQRLLDSLLRLSPAPGLLLKIIIVDNDPEATARSTVEAFATRTSIPVEYAVAPDRGVSQARNRALALVQGEYFAFVDDDETVEPGWLNALLATARACKADAVFGPVLSELPPEAPAWLRRSGLFDRPRFPTGTRRALGGTGNVLLRTETVRRVGRGFDPAFGLSGGEDTEYFARLDRSGAVMVWCDEAIATEAVAPERATYAWLVRRHYGAGKAYARIFAPGLASLAGLASASRCLAGLAALTLAAPLSLLAGRHVAARVSMRLARCLGRLAALPGGQKRNGSGT